MYVVLLAHGAWAVVPLVTRVSVEVGAIRTRPLTRASLNSQPGPMILAREDVVLVSSHVCDRLSDDQV